MSKEQNIVKYINSLLFDIKLSADMPEELNKIDGIKEIDDTLRGIRTAIK